MSMRYLILMTTILIGLSLNLAHASEPNWKDAVLEGEFVGVSSGTPVTGETSFSFGLGKPVKAGGDIQFCIYFRTPPEIELEGGNFYDLGALRQPPRHIDIPKRFARKSGGRLYYMEGTTLRYRSDGRGFLLGHYYYMQKGTLHAVFRINSFDVDARTTLSRHWYGLKEKAKGSLGFRYTASTSGLNALNALLSGTRVPSVEKQAPVVPEKTTVARLPSRSDTEPKRSEPLLAEYEGFQKSTSSFLDLPLDEVSVVKCDQLIDTGTAVKSKVSQEITLLHEQIREATADVVKYKDRIGRITNLQLKDRVTTKINQLEANNQERRVNLKKWEARQKELDTSLRTLREYRDILK